MANDGGGGMVDGRQQRLQARYWGFKSQKSLICFFYGRRTEIGRQITDPTTKSQRRVGTRKSVKKKTELAIVR